MRCYTILGAFLLAIVYGSSPNSETSIIESGTGTNCTELTFKKFFVCLYRFGDFMTKMYFLDVKSPNSMNKFKTSCLSMADCTESFECQNNKEPTDSSKKVRESCETLNFLGTDFITCLTKLEELKPAPECYKTWGPFDGFIIKDKLPDELCKNMVGKDNCMKKLVSETCGEEDSQKLLNMLKNTTEYRHCDFSKL
ncbi:T20D4.11-like domain-containing protein [Caenorhabditis elegans]|uniref:T20D4.11-like domain-containing protein n=1 Tax=Caenorhabditis elegans TaxID=6239 RepID=O45156_CAEEL|nr:DUF19 domain-containing protein [Caenorhabditis elegans]CCD62954.1 DUF19 domain-containing protein [Caenorhabditis elegans]|eukprot:NP_503926.1 Uncharacterized protein CELE_C17B7.4 [Caenorhabditis elegans]